MLDAPGEGTIITSRDSERKKFQEGLSGNITEMPSVDISRINEGQRTTQDTRDKGIGE